MSLHLLNAGGVLENRYRGLVGPSRVATAVAQHHGPEALHAWHGEFGNKIFDHWRLRRPGSTAPPRSTRWPRLGCRPASRPPPRPTSTTTRCAAALHLFDGVRLLAASPDFFELKRTRTAPPDVYYRADDDERNT